MSTHNDALVTQRSHYAELACTLSTRLLIEWDTLTQWERAECQRTLHTVSHMRDVLTQQVDWEQFKTDRANGIEYIGSPSPAWSN